MAGNKGHQDPQLLAEFNKHVDTIKDLRDRGTTWEKIKLFLDIQSGGETILSTSTIRRYLVRHLETEAEKESEEESEEDINGSNLDNIDQLLDKKWKVELVKRCEDIALVYTWAATSGELPKEIRYDLLYLYVNKKY